MHNVGSMFRTADAAGVSKIFLTGYTPAPIDRFGRKVKEIAKVALGAEETVPWEKRDIHELIAELKGSSVRIIALEQHPASHPYMSVRLDGPAALIVGNEVGGIPEEVLKEADTIIEIPMRGKKESLNVAVATGIALYSLIVAN
jgi:tRNA G18 (ribose-2'-O)-methylase SpoU